MSTFINDTESVRMGTLSVVLIGPQEDRRRAIATAVSGPQASVAKELGSYPKIDDLTELFEEDHDVVLIDLDPDPDKALEVVENICGNGSLTVMVYSSRTDPELLVRCMQAGAREFLTEPIMPNSVTEALVRASVRREELHRLKKARGSLLVFVGAKGGSGVTTVSSNFALALAKESGAKVALLDLDWHLGDAALSLGITSKFSIADALENTTRLDSHFLSALLAKHSSGLSVLAAPDAISAMHVNRAGIEKLLRIAREEFQYVVVDAGSNPADISEALFEAASTVYVVTQVGIPELRNANRLISRFFQGPHSSKLEIVLNRFMPRMVEIDDAAVNKALTRPVKWKVPNDFAAARRAQNTGIPIVMEDSTVSRAIHEMSRKAWGHTTRNEKKKRFSLFR